MNVSDTASIVRKYRKEALLTLPLAIDRTGADSVAAKYGVEACPTNYLVGVDGKVIYRSVGFDEHGLRAALEKAGVSSR